MRGTIRTALAIACAGGVAQADVTVNDIKNASQLNISVAQISLDGESFEPISLHGALTKSAGSLTLDIPASVVGLPIAVSLHAIGVPIGNGRIFFQTYNTYKPAIALPDGSTLDSEIGTFTMQTWSIGGAQAPLCGTQPCAGGTGYQILGGSLTAGGSFGAVTVALEQGAGVGGVTRAKLGKLKSPPVHLSVNGAPELPVCSGTVETHAVMKVVLGSPAPAGGSRVDLSSTASNFRFAHSVLVPQGRDTAAIDVHVPAYFTGAVAMTAAAGGRTNTTTLDVRPSTACTPPPRHYGLQRIVSCAGCAEPGALNNEGDQLVAINGVVAFAHAGTLTPLAQLWGASSVGASSINDAGQIAGRFTKNDVTQAYRADMLDGAHQPLLLGAMTPMALAPGGAVLGYRNDATTGRHEAVVNRGSGIVELPLASSYGIRSSRALFITQNTIVGTYTGNDEVLRGYRFHDGVTTTLPMIGGSWAIPAGVMANGSIAVNAGTIGAVIAANGAITQYGAPPRGYSQFVVKDINKWGYAIGTATCTACTTGVPRAFVYIPGSGFTALSGYVSNLGYVDDALAINDDNQISIHGALTASQPDYFLLSL